MTQRESTGVVIPKGTHYLASDGGHFDFGPEIGELRFRGKPIGPGSTDTIYERLADVVLPSLGQAVSVPIEMTAVSLESIDPLNIQGRLFDVSIHLTPGKRSTGEMTITLHRDEKDTSGPHGVYNTNVAIFFTATFTPRDGGSGAFEKEADIFIQSTAPGRWSLNPPPNVVTVKDGPKAKQTNRFFVVGTTPMLDLRTSAGGANKSALVPDHAKLEPGPVPDVKTIVSANALLEAAGGLAAAQSALEHVAEATRDKGR